MYTYIPTLLDYQGVSQLQSQSPTLAYRWPKLPNKRKFGSVAHKKLRFKLHMFPNSKIIWLLMLVLQFLASFSCMIHVVRCKQKEEKITQGGGGGRVGDANKKEIFWGGVSSANAVAGGAGLKKRSPDLRSPEVGISLYTRLFCKGVWLVAK